MTLTCGTFGNVIRFLPPLVIGEDLLDEGLSILEDAFAAVCGDGRSAAARASWRREDGSAEELEPLVTAAKAKPFWLDQPAAPPPASRCAATERATWR